MISALRLSIQTSGKIMKKPKHRIKIMRDLLGKNYRGLEIGPSFRPVAPKRLGYDVETVDHATQEELREKYKNKPQAALDNIEEVDYVWQGGPLPDLIGKTDYYSYIISSHSIEHTTDMVRFLRDCESLLRHDGVLVLAIPDKRYCLDFFRPPTTTGSVLQAYWESRDRHSDAAIFDHFNLLSKNGKHKAWAKEENLDELRFLGGPDAGLAKVEEARATPEYFDAHGWQFTPSSFRMIVDDLRQLNLCGFGIDFFEEGTGEFFIRMRKGYDAPVEDRLELAKQAFREQFEMLEHLSPATGAVNSISIPQSAPKPWYQRIFG